AAADDTHRTPPGPHSPARRLVRRSCAPRCSKAQARTSRTTRAASCCPTCPRPQKGTAPAGSARRRPVHSPCSPLAWIGADGKVFDAVVLVRRAHLCTNAVDASRGGVTADDVGSHFRRNRRCPGTHPLVGRRFFALSCRRRRRAEGWRSVGTALRNATSPLR